MYIWEYQVPRSSDATHRAIAAIYCDLELTQDDGGKNSGALIVWLNREGQSQNGGGKGNGRPRPPKRRTIDLRVGDYVLAGGRWAKITVIRAHSSSWLTEAEALAYRGDGYVYRLPQLPSGYSGRHEAANSNEMTHRLVGVSRRRTLCLLARR